jgi:hypothetical protein
MSSQDPPGGQFPEQGEVNVNPHEQGYAQQPVNTDPREQQQYWQGTPPPQQQGGYVGQGYYAGPGPQQMYPGQYGQPWPQRRRRRGAFFWIFMLLIMFVVIVILLGGILGLVFGRYGAYSSTETRNFSANAHPTLLINDDIGTVRVHTGSNGNSVTVQATKQTNGFWGNPNDMQVNYSQNGNTIIVNANVNKAVFFSLDHVDLDITVPSTADLQLKTETGTIDVNGVSGQMSLSTATGTINATQDALSGSSSLTANTGTITFNGSIDTSRGTYLFQSNTGSVDVTLPGNSSFHMIASTDTGSITSDFPVNIQHPSVTGAKVDSDVGSSPQVTVTLNANTGSIALHKG